jgi:glycosyltransferase involved in cell wall biosynthesis
MRVAFIHQNTPGQFRFMIPALVARGDQVLAIGDQAAIERWGARHERLGMVGYRVPPELATRKPDPIEAFGQQAQRGRLVAGALRTLVERGLAPDLVVGHPGWGELLFVRSVLPAVPLVPYCEFYYHDRGTDVDFDPEFPPGPRQAERLQLMRTPLLHACADMTLGLAPTAWQAAQFPPEYRPRIEVVHEGVDLQAFAPDPQAEVELAGRRWRHGEPVVTFIARNLEPYRGFHVLMRSLPRLQQLAPQAQVLIVGGDEVSYGVRLPAGETYRARLAAELGDRVDWSRVHFSPRVAYETHRRLLQVSAVHVHLNYPFVLSWSAVEAMAAGCCIVAGDTPPVREAMTDGESALLVPFFDAEALAGRIARALDGGADAARLRAGARAAAARFDRRACLPRAIALLDRAAGMTR